MWVSPVAALGRIIIAERLDIAACSVAALWCWAGLLSFTLVPIDWLLAPLAVTCAYQWNRLTDQAEDRINCPAELAMALTCRNRIRLLCATGACVTALVFSLEGWSASSLLLVAVWILGFAYSSRLVPSLPSTRLKTHLATKNLASAVGWAVVTVLYPSLHSGRPLNAPTIFIFLYMMASVFAVEVIWDLRDVCGDRLAGIRTLATVRGTKATSRILVLANWFAAGLALAAVLSNVLPWVALLLPIHSLVLIALARPFAHLLDRQRLLGRILVALQTTMLVVQGILARYP